ncbi:MAG: hypothetical protein G01um10145_514 [Microgenomates group bacterium Gr01-1014_5]|nr:MAG: hypothetical protein G01um10145_514 [Microgenomates group bacterium Gr01-1014_5]
MITEREKTEAYYEYVKRLIERCYEAVNEVPGLRGSNGKITYADFVNTMGQGLVELGVFTPKEVRLKTTNTGKEPLSSGAVYQFLDSAYYPEIRTINTPEGRFTLTNRLSVFFSAIISKQGNIATHDNVRCALNDAGFSSSEQNIKTSIHHLRRKLEEFGLPEDIIVTVLGKGYRFIAEVVVIQKARPSVQPAVRT